MYREAHILQARQRCLELAVQSNAAASSERIVQVAREYADFVLGTDDAALRRAAGDVAEVVNAEDRAS